MEYYDAIIAGIAASLLGGVALAVLTPVSVQTGVFLGAGGATLFMYDAMIRHPPLPRSDPRVAVSALVWHAVVLVFAVAALTG